MEISRKILKAESRRTFLAHTALVLGAFAMGASPVFVRLADVGPLASAFWRVALALPVFWMWAQFESNRCATWVTWSVLLAGTLFAFDLLFWHLAIFNTTIANAAFFATTSPIWVALGAWLLMMEKPRSQVLYGITLCLVGGAALIEHSRSFAPQNLVGDIYGLITAVFFGSYVLAVRAARTTIGPASLSLVSTFLTTVILFLIAISYESQLLPRSFQGVVALLGLALVSQVGGQGLLTVALGTLPATFSSLVIFLEAIAAAVFGWLILGEGVSIVQFLGAVLILLGIYVARPRHSN